MDINFATEIRHEGASFRYSRGPSLRKGHEIHSHYEIIYYIDGDATFISGDDSVKLEKRTLIFVPKGCFHNFKIKHQNKYVRLTVSFPDLPILTTVFNELNGIVISREGQIIKHAENIIKNMTEPYFVAQGLSVFASFLSMMSELTKQQRAPVKTQGQKSIASQCLAFIDEHFTENITVDELAKKYFVSKSFLFSEFKGAFGISIHKYVTQRRMIYANKLLSEGK